ncbi:MAG: S41 family peptidase [Candidatus Shapirobacteria bacterium]|jgi:carboxyl-terminal processing protease|nr:S41 family peptidase [Candidatus Shapirobacteria bacterium]
MMNFKYIRNTFVILALLSVVFVVGFKIGKDTAGVITSSNNKLNLSLMWKVKDKLSQTFLEKDKMIDKNMEYGAIQGMVAALDDPYTVFLPPTDNKSANEDLAGQFGGVGISLGYKDKTLAVVSPLPKSPAEKAGVKAGDLILNITDKNNNVDKDTNDMALDEAVKLIRGEVGTEVTLKMFREGKVAAYDVVLKRDNIVVPSIELEFKEQNGKKVAWIKLYKFTETLFDEWPEKVAEINKEKEKGNFGGIVLDLRNNPGGFLQASVLVASDFIKSGTIVTQESSNGREEKYDVLPNMGNLLKDKLVVLVNGGSASAAEILAGAIRDFSRAKLVGEKSFGKGTVQQPEDFPDGSGLHVTVAKWLLPSGKNIHKEGIVPDVEVKSGDDPKIDLQLNKAIEVLLK